MTLDKKIDETRNFLGEVKHNDLMSKKHKEVCRDLIYFEISALNGCVSISAFDSLVGVPVGIGSSELGIKICAIIVGIKKEMLSIK